MSLCRTQSSRSREAMILPQSEAAFELVSHGLSTGVSPINATQTRSRHLLTRPNLDHDQLCYGLVFCVRSQAASSFT